MNRFFIALQVVLLIALCWQTSVNRTEVGHLGASTYLYKTFRFDVFHVNPPLTRYFTGAAIGLTFPEYDWKSYSPRPQDRSEWGLGNTFIKTNSPKKIRWCVFLARCSLIPLIMLGSWFGWRLASEIYGKAAGYIFLTLWTFTPLVLGWGLTICPDVVAASLGIVAIYFFRRWLHAPVWWNALLTGITVGLLPLAKLTWIVAFPIWIVIWLIRGNFKPQSKQFVAMVFLALYVINVGYAFDGSFKLLKDHKFISQTLTANEFTQKGQMPKLGNRFENSFLGYVPVPLPADFVQGFDTQRYDFERGIESYFRGQYSPHGWWYYYLYLLGVKEPLGVWILLAITVVVTCCCRTCNASIGDELLLVIPAVTLLVLISSQTGFSLHPRYIILILPFVYLWISKLGRVFEKKNRFPKVVIIGLLGWVVVSSLLWFPHSMSYFNELVRSPWHGRYFSKENPPPLLGSNIDWGQNVYFLKKWYDKNLDKCLLFVDYTCSESLDRLGMKTAPIPLDRATGWYAIGVNELFGSSKKYEDFQMRVPEEIIGYGIYVYHIPPLGSDKSSIVHKGEPHECH